MKKKFLNKTGLAQVWEKIKSLVNSRVSSMYTPAGSVAFANLPALSADVEGFVYNMSDDFTTTSDFVEGADHDYKAGVNVAVVNVGTKANPVYKFDVLGGGGGGGTGDYNDLENAPKSQKFVPYISAVEGNLMQTGYFEVTFPDMQLVFQDMTDYTPYNLDLDSWAHTFAANKITDVWVSDTGQFYYMEAALDDYTSLLPYQGNYINIARVQTDTNGITSIAPMYNTNRLAKDSDINKFNSLNFETYYVVPKRNSYITYAQGTTVEAGDVIIDTTNKLYWIASMGGTLGSSAPTIGNPYSGDIYFYYGGPVGFEGAWKVAPDQASTIVWYFSFIAGGLLASKYPERVKDLILLAFDHIVSDWISGATYAVGQQIAGSQTGGMILECVTAGTTGADASVFSNLVIDGTVTDGTVTWKVVEAWNGTAQWFWKDAEPNGGVRDEDSHDSYAALFIWMINEYVKATGDSAWLTTGSPTHLAGIKTYAETIHEVIYYNLATQLTVSGTHVFQGSKTPSGGTYDAYFFMDNCEVYAGVAAAIELFTTLGDSTEVTYVETYLPLSNLITILEGYWMENMTTACYRYERSIEHFSAIPTDPPYYPWIMAQGSPSLWDVPLDALRISKAFTWANSSYPKWWARHDTDGALSLYGETGLVKYAEDPIYATEVLEKVHDYIVNQKRAINIDIYAYYETLKLIVGENDSVAPSGGGGDCEQAMVITAGSGTTLTAEVGHYYRFTSVDTLTITLPTITGATKVQGITFLLGTGSTPAVTFTAQGSETIRYQDTYSIEASSLHEVTALWNGSEWTITSIQYATS